MFRSIAVCALILATSSLSSATAHSQSRHHVQQSHQLSSRLAQLAQRIQSFEELLSQRLREMNENVEDEEEGGNSVDELNVALSSSEEDEADEADEADQIEANNKNKSPPRLGNAENWMKDNMGLLGGRTWQSLTLPGSHDSGTYHLRNQIAKDPSVSPAVTKYVGLAEKLKLPVGDIINPWSQTQTMNCYDQAKGGMRYFDVRAGWQNNDWLLFHFNLGNPVSECLNDVARFAREHTSEIFLVEVSHYIGNPDGGAKQKLANMIKGAFGNMLLPRRDGFGKTVNDMVKTNKRIIVTFEDGGIVDREPLLWKSDLLINTYADSDDENRVLSYNNDQVEHFTRDRLNGQLYKLSWTMTAQPSTIEKSFDPFGKRPRKLISLADQINGKLKGWADDKLRQNKKLGNIILIDHFQTSDVVQVAINANQK